MQKIFLMERRDKKVKIKEYIICYTIDNSFINPILQALIYWFRNKYIRHSNIYHSKLNLKQLTMMIGKKVPNSFAEVVETVR